MTTAVRPNFSVDARFTSGICTPRQVAELVNMPPATVYSWVNARGERRSIVHRVPVPVRGWASIPLAGLAEASTMRALREMHLPMHKMIEAADWFRDHYDSDYALASPRIVTDGIDLFVEETGGALHRAGDGQIPIRDIIQKFLKPVVMDSDGYARAYMVNLAAEVEAEIDPRFNSGRISLRRTRMPLFAVLGSLKAGDPAAVVAHEYDLYRWEVQAIQENAEWLEKVA